MADHINNVDSAWRTATYVDKIEGRQASRPARR